MNTYFELLPIEIHASRLLAVLRAQFAKGVALTDIASSIETESIQKIRESVEKALRTESEEAFIDAQRAIQESLKWLESIASVRKEVLSSEALPPEENEVILHSQAELRALRDQLIPALDVIVAKREEGCKDLRRTLKEAIDYMERETASRTKTIVLEYERMGAEAYSKVQAIFDAFFAQLKGHSDRISDYIEPRMPQWNTEALSAGRGFLIEGIPDLPCSLLFSIKGECRLIFENVGHLLGSGSDKLVFRSICLPKGNVQALIKPIFHEEDAASDTGYSREQIQFMGMWLETEMLMKLRGERGIISLEERMVFEWGGEKRLYLAEDYYWDGTLRDYLKYPIKCKIESAKASPKKQREILSDLLQGLAAIHKNNIVHHDIKPDNILVDLQKEKSAVIADFHLAVYLGDTSRLSKVGFVSLWAPPEYAKIELNPDRSFEKLLQDYLSITTGKLDIWSMGLIFYLFTTYELPFWIQMEVDAAEPTAEAKIFEAIAGLKKGWIPEHLRSSPYFPLLEKMLEPDPTDRCTALEALEILSRI